MPCGAWHMLPFILVSIPNFLFLKKIVWIVENYFLNIFYWDHTYVVHTSINSDVKIGETCVFKFIFYLFIFIYYWYIIVLIDWLSVVHVKITFHVFYCILFG